MERNRTYETKGKQQSGRWNLTAPKKVLNANRPTLQVQCRGYPTGYKKQDPTKVIFKRDSPNTKTQRNSLRGQRMDSASLRCKSTGGAVGSAIREKIQSARKCKISSVHITAELQNSKSKELDTVTITAVGFNIPLQWRTEQKNTQQITQLSLTDSPRPCPGLHVSRTPRPARAGSPPPPGGRSRLAIHPKSGLDRALQTLTTAGRGAASFSPGLLMERVAEQPATPAVRGLPPGVPGRGEVGLPRSLCFSPGESLVPRAKLQECTSCECSSHHSAERRVLVAPGCCRVRTVGSQFSAPSQGC